MRGVALVLGLCAAACGESTAEKAATPCDAACLDETALTGLRETLKLVFNLTLQGNDVGPQDETTPCLGAGQARVHGTATSVAEQGAMELDLTYELTDCRNVRHDEDADQTYDLTITGTLRQEGTLAVQPSSTTALLMSSDDLTLTGTVYDPPRAFEAPSCTLELVQSGDSVSGTLCGREVGARL